MRALSLSLVAALSALPACDCGGPLQLTPGSITSVACGTVDGVPGQPLASATVHIDGPTKSDVATVASGEFTAPNLQPGTYTITVDSPEDGGAIEVVSAEAIVVKSNLTTTFKNTSCRDPPDLPDDGCVVGDICNRHVGSLVAGGEVIAKVGTVERTGSTDDNGHFQVCNIPEGEGVVTIRAPGFQRTFPIEITLGTPFVIELDDNCGPNSTSTGCLIASICDPDLGPNSSLVGADVTVTPAAGGAGEATHDITDTLGFFEVCALAPGSYTVRIEGEGGVDVTESVVVEAGATTTVSGPAACDNRVEVGVVEGQVCDEADGGVFTGRVELRDSAGNRFGNAVLSDPDGSFAFVNVPPGDYTIAFPDNAELQPIPITVSAFQTTVLTARNCPLPEDVCTDFVHTPETTSDGRIYFIVDKSGSMLQQAQGFDANKWESLKAAVRGVTTTFTGPDIDYALVAYPNPANTQCESDGSCVVACNAGVEREAMGASGAQINNSLSGITPFGGTPTAQTLANTKATIQNLSVIDRPLAVVLATDGAPNCGTVEGLRDGEGGTRVNCTLTLGSVCTSTVGNCRVSGNSCGSTAECGGGADVCDPQSDTSCAPFNCLDLTAVDRVREIAGLGVDVHVIGIRGSNESGGAAFTSTLNAMAVAGGAPLPAASATRFHDATNTAALQAALAAVTRRIVACNITTPFRVDNASTITLKIGASPILQNESHSNGWDVTGPNTIQLFGAACDRATDTGDDISIHRCVSPE